MARQITVEILGDAKNFSRATQEATAASNRLHSGIGHLTGAMGLATGALAALGVGIAGAFELKSAIDRTEQLGEQVFKMTKIFGLTSESASKWLYVAQATGVSAESLQKSFKILSKNLETVQLKLDVTHKLGLSPFNEEMKRMGVKLTDTHGKLRDFQSILLDTADAFKNLGPSADLAGHATILFGKSGVDLIPILQLGKQGILDLENEAQKYGLVISSDNLPKIHAYIEAHRHLDAAMQGMQLTIGTTLIPILTALSGQVIDVFQAIRGWIDNNPAVITSLQNLGEAGINFVSRAVDGLVRVLSGSSGANEQTHYLGGMAEIAANKMGGKDGLADSIVKITDNLTTFLNSKSTKDFMAFWQQVGDILSTIASWLNTIDSFLNGIVAKENQLGGFVRSLKGGTVPAGVGPKGPIAGARAAGGSVFPGNLYTVGESGTELFSPARAGTIIPHGAGGGGMVIHNHFEGAFILDGPTVDRLANLVAQRLSYATGR